MIQIVPTLRTFAEALADDAALTAWAQAAYGRKQRIFINYDLRNPPGAADCPYVALYPEILRLGTGQTRKLAQLQLELCLYDESLRIYADDSITEYAGVQNIIDFMQLAIRAVQASDLGNALLEMLEPAFETIESFPFFVAGLPLAITEDYVLGADRLAL